MKRILCCLLAAAMLALSACSGSSSSEEVVGSASAAPATSTAATDTPAAASPVSADWAPTQKVTMIVAYKAGSATDVGAQLFAKYAQEYIGQPIEIKNISANSGMKGWQTLATADPDGYTLGFINMPNIFTAIENGAGFTMQDFSPVCGHLVETSVVAVAEDSPYQTLEDLINANIAANDGGALLRAATNGVQASNDIGAALLAYTTGGWSFKHVAYGSTKDQLNALLTGECDWTVAKVSDVSPLMATGESAAPPEEAASSDTEAPREAAAVDGEVPVGTAVPETPTEVAPAEHVRVLAVFDSTRARELPDVPCMDELNYPTGWYGSTRAIVAPAGTDPTIIDYYAKMFRKVMNDPDCIAAHEEEGLSLAYMDSEALANRIDDRERFNHSLLPKLFAQ